MISRFSQFVLALTVMRKTRENPELKELRTKICDSLAFELCVVSIDHYKTWSGILNSTTFE
jgi:hypothetical protein